MEYRIRSGINECEEDGQNDDDVEEEQQHRQRKCLAEGAIGVGLRRAERCHCENSSDRGIDD